MEFELDPPKLRKAGKQNMQGVILTSIFVTMITFRICIFAWILFCQEQLMAQQDIKNLVLERTFEAYHRPEPAVRGFMKIKGAKASLKYNPLTYLGAGLLFIYQRVISEQYAADCTYEISCSEYAKKSITRFGLIKGVLLSANQLSGCAPNVASDHDPVQINPLGKIRNPLEIYE